MGGATGVAGSWLGLTSGAREGKRGGRRRRGETGRAGLDIGGDLNPGDDRFLVPLLEHSGPSGEILSALCACVFISCRTGVGQRLRDACWMEASEAGQMRASPGIITAGTIKHG